MPAYVSELDLPADRKRELLLERWKDFLTPEADQKFGKIPNTDAARLAMAMLLENQWQHQADQFGSQIMADTATADEALYTRAVLPMVRRSYAKLFNGPWSSVQPMSQPTSFVFFMDYVRESDSTNFLSVEYNWSLVAEGGVPPKAKMNLTKRQINALKQQIGASWTQEAEEDARNILGLDVEAAVIAAVGDELARNIFGRHIKEIENAARGVGPDATPTGTALTAPWNAALAVTTIPAQGSTSVTDYKSVIYNKLVDADVLFQKANRGPSTAILAGIGMAGLLQKMLTATSATAPDDMNTSSVGVTHYGVYNGRWDIWATDFMPDDHAILYRGDDDPLFAGHIYAPYIPITAMPKVYASYNASTGAYAFTDTWTRSLRERSASTVVRPYAFAPVTAASLSF